MERRAVSSTNLASVGYEPDTATLEIEFKNGGIYQYFNVPQIIADQLFSASSKGTFFAANIKNQFQFSRL